MAGCEGLQSLGLDLSGEDLSLTQNTMSATAAAMLGAGCCLLVRSMLEGIGPPWQRHMLCWPCAASVLR